MAAGDWEVETPESYSPNKFYTRASDNKGHREEIRVKVSPDIADALSRIVQSGAIPEYSTVQDIVRDAIVHRLHYLHEMGMVKGVDSAIRRQLAIERMLQHKEMASRFRTTIDSASSLIRELIRERTPEALEEAKRVIRDLYVEAANMHDLPYWRKKYMDYIETEFADLIDQE